MQPRGNAGMQEGCSGSKGWPSGHVGVESLTVRVRGSTFQNQEPGKKALVAECYKCLSNSGPGTLFPRPERMLPQMVTWL